MGAELIKQAEKEIGEQKLKDQKDEIKVLLIKREQNVAQIKTLKKENEEIDKTIKSISEGGYKLATSTKSCANCGGKGIKTKSEAGGYFFQCNNCGKIF